MTHDANPKPWPSTSDREYEDKIELMSRTITRLSETCANAEAASTHSMELLQLKLVEIAALKHDVADLQRVFANTLDKRRTAVSALEAKVAAAEELYACGFFVMDKMHGLGVCHDNAELFTLMHRLYNALAIARAAGLGGDAEGERCSCCDSPATRSHPGHDRHASLCDQCGPPRAAGPRDPKKKSAQELAAGLGIPLPTKAEQQRAIGLETGKRVAEESCATCGDERHICTACRFRPSVCECGLMGNELPTIMYCPRCQRGCE